MQSLNKRWPGGGILLQVFYGWGFNLENIFSITTFQELEERVLRKRVMGPPKSLLLNSLSQSSWALGWKDIFIIGKNRKSCCLLCYPFVFVKKNSLSYFYFWERDCNMFGQVRPKGIFWRAFHKFAKESFPSISAFNKTQKIAEKAKRLNERQKWRKKRKSSPSKARV